MHVPKKRQLQFRHFYRSVWRNASREKHTENEVDSFRTGQGIEATGTGSQQMNPRLNSRAKKVFSRDNTSRIQVDAFEYSYEVIPDA